MSSPFPGFDPYIESPSFWRGFHNNFIAFITEALNANLPSGFAASTEERVYLLRPEQDLYPDILLLETPRSRTEENERGGTATLVADTPFTVSYLNDEVVEPYIEILALGDEERVVAVIEVLSPSNKTREGYGRDAYVRKQLQLTRSDAHLLEIDFLREGQYTVAVPRQAVDARQEDWDYLIRLHRGGTGFTYDFWPVSLQFHLPRVWVPLIDGFSDVVLDLQACFERAYEAGPYRRRVDYRKEPIPPLKPEKAAWADQLLRERGVR